ncbi:spinster family MFS transporter [Sphingobium boeckii]|uniref:MFS family permease n=1 Tax=Sphingobium boeckii TaxID=1082345 RepID=A0A7W9EFK8_9SPHN|nr:MFS transporter [Sphingobium boeckii]MBB5685806.1 MFS family permease [Sphingobium boeckii]
MTGRIYRYYVLGLLMVIYAFNFLDRQIITILAPSLKADLGLTDAQLGLLFGTAFALFYALFGIPLAKLADGWHRVKTISLGLGFWSAMTAVSGFTANFAQLGAARVGVGIGEASASPAAYSLIQDYFPKQMRATALAFYSSGIYIGVGASLIFGGAVIAYWDTHYTAATAPFGLAGWQATFLAFGIPGLILALLMRFTVREPVRGAIDGHASPVDPRPFRAVAQEFGTMFPPFSMMTLARHASRKPLIANLAMFAAVILFAALATLWTNSLLAPAKRLPIATIGGFVITTNVVQWIAIAIGGYCSFSWLQSIRVRDRPAAALIGNRTFAMLSIGGGLCSYASYGLSPFLFLYASQTFGVGPEAGYALGWVLAVSGGLGTIFGGWVADKAKIFHPAGRLRMVMVALVLSGIIVWCQFHTSNLTLFYALLGASNFLQIMWLAPVAASCQDLVLPRMRGAATAVFFLGVNIIGLGLGPYMVGLISDASGDLRFAMLSVLFVLPVTLTLFYRASRNLPALEASVAERATEAGELG